jgi:uncharacterized membrane protein YidH (DUF202 family)
MFLIATSAVLLSAALAAAGWCVAARWARKGLYLTPLNTTILLALGAETVTACVLVQHLLASLGER